MAKIFVHLSDIHFGQEKGGDLVIHTDVKERLIEDVLQIVRNLPGKRADGIIVSGDIAYAGKKDQYKNAGLWLDRIAGAVGCAITDIQVVPGNHDIDHEEISLATEWMLNQIAQEGEGKLDAFLATDRDRELLYGRFSAYRPFAEGYDSPLDNGGGLAGDRIVELVPGRSLRFIGLNTALICSKRDQEGRLLLGARQRVLPKNDGQELVVIAHHPLHWLQDSEDARRYVRSRARVFISGHEHKPAVQVEVIDAGCDLMMLAAGAAVPPTANDSYTYTYNVLEFGWDQEADALDVVVHPRVWSEEKKDFVSDTHRLGGKNPNFKLGCPNFKRAFAVRKGDVEQVEKETVPFSPERKTTIKLKEGNEEGKGESMSQQYPLLLLRFFRDLTGNQRLAILIKLGVLPDDWPEPLTHAVERHAVDSLEREGRLSELEAEIKNLTDEEEKGEK